MDLNKVMLIGRLTRDPELRTIPSGVQVATFAVATNRVYTDSSGARQEAVEFHEMVLWRRLAEIAAQYLRKGSKVYVEGRLQTRSWDDPNGLKRYKTEVVAENMIMLDRPVGAGTGGSYQAAARGQTVPQGVAPKEREGSVQQGVPPVHHVQSGEQQEDLPTIDIDEEGTDEEKVSVEDIPF